MAADMGIDAANQFASIPYCRVGTYRENTIGRSRHPLLEQPATRPAEVFDHCTASRCGEEKRHRRAFDSLALSDGDVSVSGG
jgi:hypothetical protein